MLKILACKTPYNKIKGMSDICLHYLCGIIIFLVNSLIRCTIYFSLNKNFQLVYQQLEHIAVKFSFFIKKFMS